MLDDVEFDNRQHAGLKHVWPCRRPPFECIALLLQGGGALGAYQGGVYEGLAEAGLHPDRTAGISIRAINAALPPGFPAIEIEGEHYWDGGLISNTPLSWVVDNHPHRDTLAFQVDLWSSRGALPRNMAQVPTRQKEIQYSSRTRAESDRFRE